jgi:hypothetical protein
MVPLQHLHFEHLLFKFTTPICNDKVKKNKRKKKWQHSSYVESHEFVKRVREKEKNSNGSSKKEGTFESESERGKREEILSGGIWHENKRGSAVFVYPTCA